jgi:TolB-like protein/class 3 adenylate cyclase/Tfp pilus assembly protein PilF
MVAGDRKAPTVAAIPRREPSSAGLSRMITRRLAAILAADVVGFSKLIGEDEAATLAALREIWKSVVDPILSQHGGRIFKLMGDGMLAEFPSAVSALRATISIQEALRTRNTGLSGNGRIEVRIGVHQGDVVVEGSDLLGDGVNIAARLQGLAEPGGICISARVHEDAAGKIALHAHDMGEQALKNIARPVRAYRLDLGLAQNQVAIERPALTLPDRPSIAVLPFENMSGDSEQEYFADGVVEDVITALSRFRQLFVIARNSSFTYKGRAVDVKQVGRELGVRYVLEGSVRKSGTRLRITGQLIDTSTGAHLWADRIDGRLEDIFDLQDRITASVVGAIAPKVEQAEIERAKRKATESLDAYDFFLRGMASYYQVADKTEIALGLFNRAIELDADFASAYAMGALCYLMRKAAAGWVDPKRETAEAVSLARRAMELGKDDAHALAMSGVVLAHMGRDISAGVALTDRAVMINPNLAVAWVMSGWVRIWLGEPDAALERVTRAIRLSPLDPYMPGMQNAMAHAHFFAGRYSEASSLAAMVLREFPDFHDGLRIAAISNALAGRLEQASQAMGQLRRLHPALRVSNLGEIQGPYQRPEDITTYEQGMRKAGLPE